MTMMKKTTRRVWVLLLSLCSVWIGCECQVKADAPAPSPMAPSTTTSKILIHIPFQLHDPAGFSHIAAEFGFPLDSNTPPTSLSEFVYFIDDANSICHVSSLEFNKNKTYPDVSSGDTTFKTPFLLLVRDSPQCSAVTKARHAQQIGAAALIIADSECRCSVEACPKDSCSNSAPPALVHDGSALDISIPTFLLNKATADKVIEKLKANQPVLMQLTFGLELTSPNATLPIYFHLWTTAYDHMTLDVQTYANIKHVVDAFEGYAQFAPRYAILNGHRFGCGAEGENGPCDHLCTNGGRYCTVHATDLSGHAVLNETVRQLCLWEHLAHNKWWNYILYHKEYCCADPHRFAQDECIEEAYKYAELEHHEIDTINQCMTDAGDIEKDIENALLQDMMTKQTQSSVVAVPALTVNRKVLTQSSSYALFEEICSLYWNSNVTSIPNVCYKCGACPNKITCLEQGKCVDFSDKDRQEPDIPKQDTSSSKKAKGNRGWKVFWTLTILGLLGGGAYVYYKKQYDEDFRAGPSLNAYFQLTGEE